MVPAAADEDILLADVESIALLCMSVVLGAAFAFALTSSLSFREAVGGRPLRADLNENFGLGAKADFVSSSVWLRTLIV